MARISKDEKLVLYRRELLSKGYRIISGKIFDKNNEEIKYQDFRAKLMCEYAEPVSFIEDLIDELFALGSYDNWPELNIVKEAKELGAITKDMEEAKNAPFKLEPKQYLILNRLLYHPEDEVIFITTGIGGSGKSTFLNIIKQLFDNDYSSASLSDLTNDFTVAEAVKHRLICSDELAKGELDCKVLKQLASKQTMFVNPKHKTGYPTKTQSALFWCCNKAPRIDATDTGILRRIIFYSRNTVIENPDPSLNHKEYTKEELLWFARRALAYERSDWKNYFIAETHSIIMKDNSVAMYLKKSTYETYRNICVVNGLRPYSEPNWRELRDLFVEWQKQ